MGTAYVHNYEGDRYLIDGEPRMLLPTVPVAWWAEPRFSDPLLDIKIGITYMVTRLRNQSEFWRAQIVYTARGNVPESRADAAIKALANAHTAHDIEWTGRPTLQVP